MCRLKNQGRAVLLYIIDADKDQRIQYKSCTKKINCIGTLTATTTQEAGLKACYITASHPQALVHPECSQGLQQAKGTL